MYIVTYTSGSWDDFHRGNLFVTNDKELANTYVEKANKLLVKVKEYYHELDEKLNDDDDPMRGMYLKLWVKYHTLGEVNAVSCEEIEIR
jgi:hypothetical protein